MWLKGKKKIWGIKKKIWRNVLYFYDQIFNLPPDGKTMQKPKRTLIFKYFVKISNSTKANECWRDTKRHFLKLRGERQSGGRLESIPAALWSLLAAIPLRHHYFCLDLFLKQQELDSFFFFSCLFLWRGEFFFSYFPFLLNTCWTRKVAVGYTSLGEYVFISSFTAMPAQ